MAEFAIIAIAGLGLSSCGYYNLYHRPKQVKREKAWKQSQGQGGNSNYNSNAQAQPVYQQQSYNQPSYAQQPSYGNNSYNQPSYAQQPAYNQQQAYGQPQYG